MGDKAPRDKAKQKKIADKKTAAPKASQAQPQAQAKAPKK